MSCTFCRVSVLYTVLVHKLEIPKVRPLIRGTFTPADPDLGELSEGELLDLAVPSQSVSRRALVIWLYLKERTEIGLEQFDVLLTFLAEKELHKRAASEIAR
jgi:hypothetical protein